MRKSRLLTVASGTVVALGMFAIASPATAQDAQGGKRESVKPRSQADSKATANDVIIVTAERKPEDLQKYGGTATVTTGQELKERGVQNIVDLQGRIPGLEVLPNNNNIEVYIRGVGSSNNTELGDPAVGTYFDGVYIPRPAGFGSIFFDIDRVEVNFGPQGTLRGRNATAGTVNIIPWHPGLNTYDAYAEVGVGNYAQNSQEAMLNVPIGDTIAIRLGGEHLYHGSYTHNLGPVTGVRGPEWENNFAGRAQLLWKPSSKFDLLLGFDDTVENGGGVIGTNLAVAEGNNINISSANLRDVYLYPTDPHQHAAHSGEKAEVNYHGDDFNVQLVVSHRHLYTEWLGAPPGLLAYDGGLAQANAGDSTGAIATDYSHYETQNVSNSSQQELRFTAPTGAKFDWTLGAFHFTESQASFLGSVADQNAYFQGIEFNTRTTSESLAAYTDDTFHVDSKLSLTGGLRYSDETKQRTGVAARYLLALGAGDYNCCMGPILGTPGFQFAGLNRTDFTLPDGGPNAAQQALSFYLNGIQSFGINDTVPSIFPGGLIPAGGVRTGPCVPNPQTPYLKCAADGLYNYETIDATEFFAQGASDHYHYVDWRARAQYQIDPDHMVYALVATGHKAGGFNDNFGTGGIAPTYRPEKLTNYEIGFKNRFNVGTLPVKLNVSAFYDDYKDKVESSLLSIASAANFVNQANGQNITFPSNFAPGAIIVNFNYNAANAVIAGIQYNGSVTIPALRLNIGFDGLWLPEAKVTASQTIEDFRFQSDIDPQDAGFRSIQDHRLARTPRDQINLQISQKFDTPIGSFGWVVAPGYRSSSYATIFNGVDYAYQACLTGGTVTDINGKAVAGCSITKTYRGRLNDTVPSYFTLDLGAEWVSPNKRFTIDAYANNVTYKGTIQGILISQTGGTTAFLPRPATYGLRFRVRF